MLQTRQDGLVVIHQAQVTTSTEGIAEYDLRNEGESAIGAIAGATVGVGQAEAQSIQKPPPQPRDLTVAIVLPCTAGIVEDAEVIVYL